MLFVYLWNAVWNRRLALHIRLDLIRTRLDLIRTRLDLIRTRLDLIRTWLDLIRTRMRRGSLPLFSSVEWYRTGYLSPDHNDPSSTGKQPGGMVPEKEYLWGRHPDPWPNSQDWMSDPERQMGRVAIGIVALPSGLKITPQLCWWGLQRVHHCYCVHVRFNNVL